MDLEIDVLTALTSVHVLSRMAINLYKGACSTDLQHERVAVKTFIKGTRKEKELLKSEDSELYVKIKSVWELRKMHMI